MSIKTDAVVIRDEVIPKANTAVRVGTNLVDIADDLVAKQASIDLKQNKPSEGAFVDGDKTKLDGITAGATPDQVLPTSGVDFDPVGTDNSDDNAVNSLYSGLATSKQDALDVVGQAEAEAGTSTTERTWTAERVKQAIVALGGSGSVSDTAYGISWNGVTGTAPSKNALYDFIESQVFKVDENSKIVPIFWGGTQAEYNIDFPSGHTSEYFVVVTDGVVPPTTASDIVVDASGFSGNLSATDTDVQTALGTLDALVSSGTITDAEVKIAYENNADTNAFTDAEKVIVGNTSGTNTGDQVPTTGTGTAIDLTNVVGAYYNIGASSTATAFTVPTVAVGGFAVVESASTTTEPTVTVTGGTATEIPSLAWVASTTMYLNIYSYDGTNVFYYWSDTTSTISELDASDAGVFNGSMLLNNQTGVFYDTYDLGVSGSITFSEIAGGKVFGAIYLPVISDGVTPLASLENLNEIFKEQYGVIEGRILPVGLHSLYIMKTPPNSEYPSGAVALNIPENGFSQPTATDSVPMTVTDIANGTSSGTDPIVLSASSSGFNAEGGVLNIVDGNYVQIDYNGTTNGASVLSLTSLTTNASWLSGSTNTSLEHAIYMVSPTGIITQQLSTLNTEGITYTTGLWKLRMEILGTNILYKYSSDGGLTFTTFRTEPIGITPLNIFLHIAISGNEMLNPRILNL